jgi:peptidoglycan hydrolase CwlO-like protein
MAMNKKKVKIPADLSRDVGVMIEHFDEKLTFVMEQVVDHTTKINAISQSLEEVKEDIGIIKMDIEQIKHDLKNKVDRNEFAVLERRVALLESRR